MENEPIRFLSTNIYLFNILTALICALLCGTELIGYFTWYIRAKRAAAEGKFLETRGRRSFQLALVVLMMVCLGTLILYGSDLRISLMMVALLVLIAGSVAVSIGATKLMKRKNFSARKNKVITMVIITVMSLLAVGLGSFGIVALMDRWDTQNQDLPTYEFRGSTWVLYRDEIPLKVQDLTEVDPEIFSYRISSSDNSFLLRCTDAYQRPRYDMLDQPDIRYSIVDVKAPWLNDFVLEKLLETDTDFWSEDIYGNITYDEYRQVEAADWGARQAYRLCNGENEMSQFLLCYEDRFVIFDPDWEPTPEQQKIVGEFLG